MKKAFMLSLSLVLLFSVYIIAEDPAPPDMSSPDMTALMAADTGAPAGADMMPPDDGSAGASPDVSGADMMPAPDSSGASPDVSGADMMPAPDSSGAASPDIGTDTMLAPDNNANPPGMEGMPGMDTPGMEGMPGTAPGDTGSVNAGASAEVNVGGDGASASVSAGVDTGMPGMDMPGMPGGTETAPGDTGAAGLFPPDNGAAGAVATAGQAQGTTAPGNNTAKKVSRGPKGIPTYKAVPMTNDLRPMVEETGELGQVQSLARYMSWGYSESSHMKGHTCDNLNDNFAKTAWVVNKPEYGMGQSVTFLMDPIYFAGIHEQQVDFVTWTGFKVINGFDRSKEDWFNNSRVRTMKIYLNKKAVCNIELYDSTNWQTITFKKPMSLRPGDRVKAVITDYFEGYKYANTAISEFLLVGKPGTSVVDIDHPAGRKIVKKRTRIKSL